MVTPRLQGNLADATDTHVATNSVFPGKSVIVSVAMMLMMMMILKIVVCKRLHCVLMLCEMVMFSLYSKYLRQHFVSKMFVVSFYSLPLSGTDFICFSSLISFPAAQVTSS